MSEVDSDLAKTKVGLIYRNVWLYRLAMYVLYRSRYRERYEMVADEIPPGSNVVDICCGDAPIAPLLKEKGCEYVGLDINPRFVGWGRREGIDIRLWNAEEMEIPEADVICAQSCLYQFIPNERRLVEMMVGKARKMVLIAEPVENLTTGGGKFMSKVAKYLTRVNGKVFDSRFTEESFRGLFSDMQPESLQFKRIADRDELAIVTSESEKC
jgi:hypothetical protein